jgi:hypothetical protein
MWRKIGPAGPPGPPGASGTGSIQAQNQGVPLPGTFTTINFTGAGVAAAVGGAGLLTVTITGGSSSGNLGLAYAIQAGTFLS